MLPNGFIILYVFCFISNTFISSPRLKLTKNQANAKQHPEAEFFTVWILFTFFINVIIQKMIRHVLKNKLKNKCMCSWYYTINHDENEDENKSHNNRFHIDRHVLRRGHKHKYSEYIKCVSCYYDDAYMYWATPKQYLKLNSWKSWATLSLSWKNVLLMKKGSISPSSRLPPLKNLISENIYPQLKNWTFCSISFVS